MTKKQRCNHSPAFKAEVALAAVRGEEMLAELAQLSDMRAHQITQWRSQLLESAAGVFGSEAPAVAITPVIDVKTLHASDKLRLRRDRRAHAGQRCSAEPPVSASMEGALDKAGLLPSARR